MSELITVTGNLAADPERRSTAGGDAVVAFRIGSTQRRYDKESNSWVDAYTNWYHVSAFRTLAEHALQSLRKGDRVIVTGTLRLRTWENDSRSGVSADIDAHAVGPDLRWGTTVFTRTGRAAEGGDARPSDSTARGPVDADGWTLPAGGRSDDGAGGHGTSTAERSLHPGAASELVPAGGPPMDEGAETPF